MLKLTRVLFFIGILFCSSHEIYAANKSKELLAVFKASKPYGEGKLYKLLFHVYDAQVWTDAKEWSYSEPFALSLTYRMKFESKELVDRSFEEIRKQVAFDETKERIYRPQLEKVFPNVKKNDRITALYDPVIGVIFFANGHKTGTINSLEFSKQFLDIWLGSRTSEPAVRNKLIGK